MSCDNPTCARALGDLEMDMKHWRERADKLRKGLINVARLTAYGPYTQQRWEELNQYARENIEPKSPKLENPERVEARTAQDQIKALQDFIRKDYETCGGDTECECISNEKLCYFCEARRLLAEPILIEEAVRCQHGVWKADHCYSCEPMGLRERNKIYAAAKEIKGETSQVLVAAEEFSEAAAALCRHVNGKVRTIQTVITELADAEIMSEQMRFYFDGAAIDAEKSMKLEALADLLGMKPGGSDGTAGV